MLCKPLLCVLQWCHTLVSLGVMVLGWDRERLGIPKERGTGYIWPVGPLRSWCISAGCHNQFCSVGWARALGTILDGSLPSNPIFTSPVHSTCEGMFWVHSFLSLVKYDSNAWVLVTAHVQITICSQCLSLPFLPPLRTKRYFLTIPTQVTWTPQRKTSRL